MEAHTLSGIELVLRVYLIPSAGRCIPGLGFWDEGLFGASDVLTEVPHVGRGFKPIR